MYSKIQNSLNSKHIGLRKKQGIKIIAIVFVALISISVYFSISDAYSWVEKDQIQVQIGEATNYAADLLDFNESVAVLAPFNLFSQDMVKFFLEAKNMKNNTVWQYPELPVDTYTPNFNITEFIYLCEKRNTKFVFFYEHGENIPFFNTDLSISDIKKRIAESERFTLLEGSIYFGTPPNTVYVSSFLPPDRT